MKSEEGNSYSSYLKVKNKMLNVFPKQEIYEVVNLRTSFQTSNLEGKLSNGSFVKGQKLVDNLFKFNCRV